MIPVRVVKVGGSLLEWPPLKVTLWHWLATQPNALNVLICGGGPLADAIRHIDERHSLGDETGHWLCIDAMSITAKLLAAILDLTPVVTQLDQLRTYCQATAAATVIFDVRQFLLEMEPRANGRRLPRDWSATSDSIAARLAETMAADELVLLKSADPPSDCLAQLADLDYVDRHFATLNWPRYRPQFVNLRASTAC